MTLDEMFGEGPVTASMQAYAAERASSWQALAAHRAGRMFLWDVLSRCGLFRQSFDGNGQVAAFAEGRRSVALELLDEMAGHAPAAFEAMLREQRELSEAVAAERAAMAEENQG